MNVPSCQSCPAAMVPTLRELDTWHLRLNVPKQGLAPRGTSWHLKLPALRTCQKPLAAQRENQGFLSLNENKVPEGRLAAQTETLNE